MSTSLNLLAASALVALVFAANPQASYAAAAAKPDSATPAPAKKHTPQQQRMVDCNHQAKVDGKKGDERKAFMSSCLKGKTGATADTTPQPKTKAKAKATTKATTKAGTTNPV